MFLAREYEGWHEKHGWFTETDWGFTRLQALFPACVWNALTQRGRQATPCSELFHNRVAEQFTVSQPFRFAVDDFKKLQPRPI